ncbi:hypothetical protein LSCM4_05624 [Leishmania orientalis]|uniref:Secreted protein n=1 Tax=Leishmania orientalis TaxID=2249476 RepID=A0A836HTL5_9TRYP|nr:hypothetical protein LSCM4_05624 [Leishmania orientalis]
MPPLGTPSLLFALLGGLTTHRAREQRRVARQVGNGSLACLLCGGRGTNRRRCVAAVQRLLVLQRRRGADEL